MSKRVLVTGHAGFVGHHCLEYWLETTNWHFVCLDSFRHKGTCSRLQHLMPNDRVETYRHDLTVPIDRVLENKINREPIDYIINIASNSAVERSTSDPTECLRNNFELGLTMLEFARRCKDLKAFVQVSTDEVYGEATQIRGHGEWDAILPSNPYAASKAIQEAMAISYFRTYNLPLVITNCMNIIGERQDPEKFIPKIIKKVYLGEEVPVYGDSLASIGSRTYLHAKDFADAVKYILEARLPTRYRDSPGSGVKPDRYNICGDVEFDNLELAQLVAGLMDRPLKYRLIPSESARAGYDRRYLLDGSLLRSLGWKPKRTLVDSLNEIVRWTLANPDWVL